jgi:DNA-binding winged helix-turn-helix (wHTH) protein
MRSKYLFVLPAAVLPGLLFMLLAGKTGNQHFEEAKEMIMMRKIGHELLLRAGDRTSRVLPVRKVDEGEYQIPFESNFSFTPDTLSAIVSQVIASQGIDRDYIVQVMECARQQVVFGYAMLNKGKNDVVACSGRTLPNGCYYISLSFNDTTATSGQHLWLIALSGLLAAGLTFYGLKLFRKRKLPVAEGPVQVVTEAAFVADEANVSIGTYLFNKEAQSLSWSEETIPLTGKEAKLLSIFAQSPNQIVEKARLQKEVWEDEGVIVGRSLDMFVSKLRKKLEKDPAVKLINIHGKGYKLEITPS